MRFVLIGLANVGILVGLGAFLLYPPSRPAPPAIRSEIVGLPSSIPAGGHQPFTIRVHNPSAEAVEVIGIDGIGCRPAGCLAHGDGQNPLGRVIAADGTLDVPLIVALRGTETLTATVHIYLRSSKGLVSAAVEVVVRSQGSEVRSQRSAISDQRRAGGVSPPWTGQ
jgi:hypothetical protein